MEGGPFFRIGDGVVDRDGDDVTPVSFNCGPRKLAVDKKCVLLVAVWCYGASCNRQVVVSSIWTRRQARKQKTSNDQIFNCVVVWKTTGVI